MEHNKISLSNNISNEEKDDRPCGHKQLKINLWS